MCDHVLKEGKVDRCAGRDVDAKLQRFHSPHRFHDVYRAVTKDVVRAGRAEFKRCDPQQVSDLSAA
jgi:hypothetical protein